MSGHILHLSILHSHVFLLNSRLGLFTASHLRGNPFSRSYRVILPSSLAVNHSSALGFSPRPPVSVYGTGALCLKLRSFSWKSAYTHYPLGRSLEVLSDFASPGGFTNPAYSFILQPTISSVGGAFTTPSLHRNTSQYWNINQLSIDYPLRVRLRPRLTLL